MKKLITLSLIVLALSACNDHNEEGVVIKRFDVACADGVLYYYNYGGQHGGGYMSPKYKLDGTLTPCSMEKRND